MRKGLKTWNGRHSTLNLHTGLRENTKHCLEKRRLVTGHLHCSFLEISFQCFQKPPAGLVSSIGGPRNSLASPLSRRAINIVNSLKITTDNDPSWKLKLIVLHPCCVIFTHEMLDIYLSLGKKHEKPNGTALQPNLQVYLLAQQQQQPWGQKWQKPVAKRKHITYPYVSKFWRQISVAQPWSLSPPIGYFMLFRSASKILTPRL